MRALVKRTDFELESEPWRSWKTSCQGSWGGQIAWNGFSTARMRCLSRDPIITVGPPQQLSLAEADYQICAYSWTLRIQETLPCSTSVWQNKVNKNDAQVCHNMASTHAPPASGHLFWCPCWLVLLCSMTPHPKYLVVFSNTREALMKAVPKYRHAPTGQLSAALHCVHVPDLCDTSERHSARASHDWRKPSPKP